MLVLKVSISNGQEEFRNSINIEEINFKNYKLQDYKNTKRVIMTSDYIFYIHHKDINWSFAVGRYKFVSDSLIDVSFLKNETFAFVLLNNIYFSDIKLEAINIDYFTDWKIKDDIFSYKDAEGEILKYRFDNENLWVFKEVVKPIYFTKEKKIDSVKLVE